MDTVMQLLTSVSTYPNLRPGDMITKAAAASAIGVSIPELISIMNNLENQGLVVWDDGGIDPISRMQRLSGWHITQKGVDYINR